MENLTYADYRTSPENNRWEIVEGAFYDMSPAPPTQHQRVVLELSAQIRRALFGGPCEVFIAPFDVGLDAVLSQGEKAIYKIAVHLGRNVKRICYSVRLGG